jgi:hypothetical protein
MIVTIIAGSISMALALPSTLPAGDELPPEALFPILLGVLGMILLYLAILGLLFLGLAVWAAYVGYGLYGAVTSLRGKDFRYVIIGPRLERCLHQPSGESARTGH